MTPEERDSVRRLVGQFTPGHPRPELTAEIAHAPCSAEARAGLYLLNGDWERAHETVQALESPLAAYWHALAHRHEPDFANSKYWLGLAGASPIHERLLAAAEREGQRERVAPRGAWDAARFLDLYAEPEHHDWTRRLDTLEIQALLELSLED